MSGSRTWETSWELPPSQLSNDHLEKLVLTGRKIMFCWWWKGAFSRPSVYSSSSSTSVQSAFPLTSVYNCYSPALCRVCLRPLDLSGFAALNVHLEIWQAADVFSCFYSRLRNISIQNRHGGRDSLTYWYSKGTTPAVWVWNVYLQPPRRFCCVLCRFVHLSVRLLAELLTNFYEIWRAG